SRCLLSFPTRRSSDLAMQLVALQPDARRALACACGPRSPLRAAGSGDLGPQAAKRADLTPAFYAGDGSASRNTRTALRWVSAARSEEHTSELQSQSNL